MYSNLSQIRIGIARGCSALIVKPEDQSFCDTAFRLQVRDSCCKASSTFFYPTSSDLKNYNSWQTLKLMWPLKMPAHYTLFSRKLAQRIGIVVYASSGNFTCVASLVLQDYSASRLAIVSKSKFDALGNGGRISGSSSMTFSELHTSRSKLRIVACGFMGTAKR